MTSDVDDKYKFYHGLTELLFKKRFTNHSKLLNLRQYQNKTEFSKYIWILKHEKKQNKTKQKTKKQQQQQLSGK